MAEQLNHTDAEIVYLDMSRASMDIAKQRANIRGVKNVVWVNDWIENIPNLALGKFNLIICSGALHHMKDPKQGLNILKDSLSLDGGMNLMVYAKYGRSGVYQAQELLRMVNTDEADMDVEIETARLVLSSLPPSSWILRSDYAMKQEDLVDGRIYDLFLHKRDVSFSVAALYRWLEEAGLTLVDFDNTNYRSQLEPRRYTARLKLNKNINLSEMSQQTQEAIAELMAGDLIKQEIYVSTTNTSEASLDDLNNVPFWHGKPKGFRKLLLETEPDATFFEATLLDVIGEKIPVKWPLNRYSKAIINMVFRSQGSKSIKQLFDIYRKENSSKISNAKLLSTIMDLYLAAKKSGQLLLKSKKVDKFPKTSEIELYTFEPAQTK